MEEEPMENSELEDGEISDNDEATNYTPLSRPAISTEMPVSSTVSRPLIQEDDVSDTDEQQKSSTDSDSDANMKEKRPKAVKPKVLRSRPESVKPKMKEKYNVWAATLQDDLMENMRGCDVTQSGKRSRDVESYDYTIKDRLNNETSFKRKRPQSTSDEHLDYYNYRSSDNKRFCGARKDKSRNVKSRLGSRSDSSNSTDSSISASRQILDLTISLDSSNEELAKDLANKLYEEKDDLLLRALNSLGREIPLQIFSETQKIELDGGMMIMNGRRRRTPGGVFLFLLKKHTSLTDDQRKEIFTEDRKISEKEKKRAQALKRDKKVEELKKTLPALASRTHLMPETVSTLSNPPPSPVTDDCNRENSCGFDDQSIVHVNITSPEKVNHHDDNDFLDLHGADDMDLF